MRLSLSKLKIVVIAALLLLAGLAWLVLRAFPVSVCLVSGKDTVELMADSVHQEGVWINRHWWWPSCDGRVLTVGQTSDVKPMNLSAICDSIESLLHRKETERKELKYYLRSHGIIDEGYTQIAAYATRQGKMTDSLRRKLTVLQKTSRKDGTGKKSKGKAPRFVLRGKYVVSWYNGNDELHHVECEPVVSQLTRKIVTVRIVPAERRLPYHSIIVTGNYWQGHDHDIPELFAVEGAPVFTKHGRFIGIIRGKEVMQ